MALNMQTFHQLEQWTTQKTETEMIKKNAKRIPSIHTQVMNPNKIQKKPRQKLYKNPGLRNQNTTNAQNLTSFSKQQQQKNLLERYIIIIGWK